MIKAKACWKLSNTITIVSYSTSKKKNIVVWIIMGFDLLSQSQISENE